MTLTSNPKQLAPAIALTMACLSLTTLAQNNAPADDPATKPKLETLVVTASRSEQPIAQLSGSLSVISQQDIQQVSHVHVSELLARVPGVWVSRGNGQEHLTAIRSPVLTGAGSCGAFYIAEDGIPVRATGFCNVNELFDLNTEQAGKIEVLRGPGTAIHGSDALHGVINVISLAPTEAAETRLSAEAGANDYGRIKVSHSDSHNQHSYRINLNGASDGGYKDDSGFDQQKLTLRYDYRGSEWSSYSLINAGNLNQETAGYVEGTDAYKDDSRKRENPYPEAYRDSQSLRWQTRFEKTLANDGVFIATPYARSTDMEFLMHFLPGTPVEENGQDSAGIQTAFRRAVGSQLTLLQGVDVEFTEAYLKQTQDGGFSSFPAGKQYDYEVDAQLLAAFLSGDYQWTERTLVTLGGRYEALEYDYDNRMLSGDTDENGDVCVNGFTGALGCRYSRPEDRTDTFHNISANAGIVFHASDAFVASSRISHGFRAPQATEMYRLQAGQLVPDLDSEEINSIEFGLQGDLHHFNYQLVTFYMKKNNVIFQSSDRLNLDDGQTRHYGLEYQLSWQFSEQWDLSTAGTFARHQYTADVSTPGPGASEQISTDGNDVDTAPRHMSTVQLGWTPTASTRLELEWVSMGKYYTDINNEHSYEGHDLLHLRARQQLSKNVSIGLRITNLTDEDYAERADYNTFSGDRYFIGEPRSVFADIQLSL